MILMPNPQKRKGDRAELEIAALISEATGLTVRRALGAGRTNAAGGDVGDLAGIPYHVAQVAHRDSIASVVRHKPAEAEAQRLNAGEEFAVTLVRLRRARGEAPTDSYRVVLTFKQWLAYLKAARFYGDSLL